MIATEKLDDVLLRADVIVLTAPLTPQTRSIFDSDRLARCRRTALLINVSRGGLIDTQALVMSLASGHIAGAALDVAEPEPIPQEHSLWKAPNLIITPHVAAAGSESQVAAFAVANIQAFVAGQPLQARYTA